MTATTTSSGSPRTLPAGANWENLRTHLSKKQLKYIKKYDNTPERLLTDHIKETWYTPRPAQMKTGIFVFLGGAILAIIVGSIIAAIIGTPDASALYYVTTQENHTIKQTWDTVWTPLRHAYRDCTIGLIGGIAAVFITRNRFKPLKPLTKWDRKEIDFHIGNWHPIGNVKDDTELTFGQVWPLIILIPLYGLVGFFAGEGLLTLVHWLNTNVASYHTFVHNKFGKGLPFLSSHLGQHGAAIATRIHESLVASLPNKLVGLFSAFFFGRRPAKAVMDDIQLWLVRRQYVKNRDAGHPDKRPPLLYLPNFRRSYYQVQIDGVPSGFIVTRKSTVILYAVLALMLAIGIYGWYILLYIANK